MKTITVILVEDPKDKGYTIFSKDIDNMFSGAVVSQGDTIDDALHNFANTFHDVDKHFKEKNNA